MEGRSLPLFAWVLHEPLILILYALVLFLFLVTVTAIGLFKEPRQTGGSKRLIFDRDYHFWQTRKKK